MFGQAYRLERKCCFAAFSCCRQIDAQRTKRVDRSLGLVLLVLLIGGLLTLTPGVAWADGDVRCVHPDGGPTAVPCANPTAYASLQTAVDAAAPGDEIRIAGGAYTGVTTRDGLPQLVVVDKSVTLIGGFAPDEWSAPNSVANPTVLDAEEAGRVFRIEGDITVTLENLEVTGGDALGLAGRENRIGAGGAALVMDATVTVRNSAFYTNTGTFGGAFYLDGSAEAAFTANEFHHNRGETWGGAIVFENSPDAVLTANRFYANQAAHSEGGRKHYGALVFTSSPNLRLIDNEIADNTAVDTCGGLSLRSGSNGARLIGNTIRNNRTGWRMGGGLCLDGVTDVLLSGNVIVGNAALGDPEPFGGGVYILQSDATLINNIIAGNGADQGSGLYITRSNVRLLHTTLAANQAGGGQAIFIDEGASPSTVTMTNTIVSTHTVGVQVPAGSTVTAESTLLHGLGAAFAGAGAVTSVNEVMGAPAFVDAADDDYHITCASAARNRGAPVGVTEDVDGESRTLDPPADLGADEVICRESATVELLSLETGLEMDRFTVRVRNAEPRTQYAVISYHDTDQPYAQETVTVTTDAAGNASAQIGARCTVAGARSGAVFAQLKQEANLVAASNRLTCGAQRGVVAYGAYLLDDPRQAAWIFRPLSDRANQVRLWIRGGRSAAWTGGTLAIHSSETGYVLLEQPLTDRGRGYFYSDWSMADLPPARDYHVHLTLTDDAGALSGADAYVQLRDRAMWVWGEAAGAENPAIWAMITNGDLDQNGSGDRDELLAFMQAPHGMALPSVTTAYFSVYPYLGHNGTEVGAELRSFLTAAHEASNLRIEALAGTHEWLESPAALQEGKDFCDEVLAFNRDGSDPAERFDGIHYDVEHDNWEQDPTLWANYLELIGYCQAQVDAYNATEEPIVFGVDVPLRFLTGPDRAGEIMSHWDVLSIVDYVTLMAYRDYADTLGADLTDGINPNAARFVRDGNALGKPVVVGVELNERPDDRVSFFEESSDHMECTLRTVAQRFAADRAFEGIAIHSYGAWKDRAATRWECMRVLLPTVHRSFESVWFTAD